MQTQSEMEGQAEFERQEAEFEAELKNKVDFWLEHYQKNGDSHYQDTKVEKLLEIYWQRILEHILEDYPENQIELIEKKLSELY